VIGPAACPPRLEIGSTYTGAVKVTRAWVWRLSMWLIASISWGNAFIVLRDPDACSSLGSGSWWRLLLVPLDPWWRCSWSGSED